MELFNPREDISSRQTMDISQTIGLLVLPRLPIDEVNVIDARYASE